MFRTDVKGKISVRNNVYDIIDVIQQVRVSGCVSMGSMGSAEPMEFWRRVPAPMDFALINNKIK